MFSYRTSCRKRMRNCLCDWPTPKRRNSKWSSLLPRPTPKQDLQMKVNNMNSQRPSNSLPACSSCRYDKIMNEQFQCFLTLLLCTIRYFVERLNAYPTSCRLGPWCRIRYSIKISNVLDCHVTNVLLCPKILIICVRYYPTFCRLSFCIAIALLLSSSISENPRRLLKQKVICDLTAANDTLEREVHAIRLELVTTRETLSNDLDRIRSDLYSAKVR